MVDPMIGFARLREPAPAKYRLLLMGVSQVGYRDHWLRKEKWQKALRKKRRRIRRSLGSPRLARSTVAGSGKVADPRRLNLCQVGDEGLEPKSPTSCGLSGCEKQAELGGAESGAVSPSTAGAATKAVVDLQPELALIVRRWPSLSESIRAAILAMASSEGGTS